MVALSFVVGIKLFEVQTADAGNTHEALAVCGHFVLNVYS